MSDFDADSRDATILYSLCRKLHLTLSSHRCFLVQYVDCFVFYCIHKASQASAAEVRFVEPGFAIDFFPRGVFSLHYRFLLAHHGSSYEPAPYSNWRHLHSFSVSPPVLYLPEIPLIHIYQFMHIIKLNFSADVSAEV